MTVTLPVSKPLKSTKLNKNQNVCTDASAKLDLKVTFFLSFANLPSSFHSLSFQAPGTTMKMTNEAGSHTQFLSKLARSCISLQNPPAASSTKACRFWRMHPAAASSAWQSNKAFVPLYPRLCLEVTFCLQSTEVNFQQHFVLVAFSFSVTVSAWLVPTLTNSCLLFYFFYLEFWNAALRPRVVVWSTLYLFPHA